MCSSDLGIVHRDLKPSNVLVGLDGHARLTDFGVVKDPEAFPTSLTLAGRLVGTVAFMAPEQITGESPDTRADLYSLGALLYVMLTWRRPIIADSIAGYLARHLTETPRAPSDIDPRVPVRLERVCTRLLQKDPARRYATARQVLAALDDDGSNENLPIHGREPTVEALVGRVGGLLRRGVGGVVAVLGPPGAGRTRLLQEAAERARAAGASTVLVGPTGAVAALSASLPPAERGTGLRAQLGESPWVLMVDDIDRVSPADRSVLGELVRDVVAIEGGRLLLVVSAEPGTTDPIVTGAATGLATEEIVLGGIDRDAVRALLRDRGIHGALGAALGRRLHEELGGMPGPILEQVDALVRAGWLVRVPEGTVRSTRPIEALRGEALPLPDRVRRVEARFLEALPVVEREALEALSVLGGPSSVALIAPLTSASESALGAALASLARAGHVTTSEDGMQELHTLASRRRSQVIYENLEPGHRASLHRAAAATLQRLHHRRQHAIAETAAHHLLHGGDPAGAYPLLIQGALRALRRGDHAAARVHCARALEARGAAEATMTPLEGARQRRLLYQSLGDALYQAGRVEQAGDAYAQALLAARTERDRVAVGKALAGSGMVSFARGRVGEAMGALEEGLASLEKGDPAWPEAANALAIVRFDTGNRAGAERLWTEAAEVGRESRNAQSELVGAWGLLLLARTDGDRDGAFRLVDDAMRRPRDARSAPLLVKLLFQRAQLLGETGDWAQVSRVADEIDGLADTYTLGSGGVVAASLRAGALAALDEPGAALRVARDAVSLCRLHQVGAISVWASPVRVLAAAGEGEETLGPLGEAHWAPDPPVDVEGVRRCLIALASVTRRPDAARDAARAALARPAAPVASEIGRAHV